MSEKRNHLIQTALKLFNQYGYHVIGIDTILSEAGIAKKTLYNHFQSKEELILAVLEKADEEFRTWFVKEVERHAEDPIGQLLAIFDVIHIWFCQKQFHGCMVISAASEFPNENSEIHQFCRTYKERNQQYIEEIVRKANLNNPNRLAKQLSLLVEGSIVTAQVSNNANVSINAKEAAEVLIRNAGNNKEG